MILETILEHCKNIEKVEPEIPNGSKYKIKFKLFKNLEDDIDSEILDELREDEIEQDKLDQIQKFGEEKSVSGICLQILLVDQNKFCVQFSRTSGTQEDFLSHYQRFRDEVLGFANDTILE